MKCDVCTVQFSSLQHAKLHYVEEHQIDGYIKVRLIVKSSSLFRMNFVDVCSLFCLVYNSSAAK